MTKAAYVVAQARQPKQPDAPAHTCHWPGCQAQVPPAMHSCKRHWNLLPRTIRAKIWAAYRPTQEVDKRPSLAYIVAAREAELWAIEYEAAKNPQRSLL